MDGDPSGLIQYLQQSHNLPLDISIDFDDTETPHSVSDGFILIIIAYAQRWGSFSLEGSDYYLRMVVRTLPVAVNLTRLCLHSATDYDSDFEWDIHPLPRFSATFQSSSG